MKKTNILGIEEANILQRLRGDFDYAYNAKEESTIYLDAEGEQTRTNKATQKNLKILDMFYNGEQWTVDKEGNSINKQGKFVFPTVNYIKTIVDQRVDMFKKRKVTMDVKPEGEEDLDLSLGVQFLMKYIWKKQSISLKLAETYQDALVYMSGFLKLGWNPITEDIDIIPISPFNIYLDPYGTEIDQMRYIHIVYKKPREYVEKTYDVKLDSEESKGWNKRGKKKKIKEFNSNPKTNPNDPINVYESWYSKDIFGLSVCVTWTEDKILQIKKVKDITGTDKFPIFAFKTKRRSNTFWGDSIVYNLIDPQLLHNKSLGFILDSLLISNNSRIVSSDPNVKISNDPSEVITISDKEERIDALNLSSVDPRWFSLVQYSGYNLAQALTSTYAVNMGGRANTQAATGIAIIQESGTTGTEADIFELTFEIDNFGNMLLYMIKDLYGKSKIEKILGTSDNLKMVAKDLAGKIIDTNYSIFFDLSDPLPEDKLSRNNLYSGLMMSHQIDLAMWAKLTGNVELLNILKEQQSQQNPLEAILGATGGAPAATAPETTEETPEGQGQAANEAGTGEEIKRKLQERGQTMAKNIKRKIGAGV